MIDLPAGRELDRAVALAIFGTDAPHAIMSEYDLPWFSTDIEAAWEVVGRLGEICEIQWHPQSEPAWRAIIKLYGPDGWAAYGDTAPLAICRAALMFCKTVVGHAKRNTCQTNP